MSQSNGVIRVKTKGIKKFAIGDEDDPRNLPVFSVDVVVAFQHWIEVDESFRPAEADEEGSRRIPGDRMAEYHNTAVAFVQSLMMSAVDKRQDTPELGITTAEALDFLARLREQYDGLVDFFRPKSREGQKSPDSSEDSEVELQFSEEKAEK